MSASEFLQRLLSEEVFTPEQLREGVLSRNLVGDTPLHCAVLYQQPLAVCSLIEAHAPLDAAGEFGFTPLHCAAYRGYTEIARTLLQAGANPNAVSSWGETPAQLAAARGHPETCALLTGSA
jgi:ankyrin repeat protein